MAKTRQMEHGAAIAWLFPSLVQVRLEGRMVLYPSPIPFPSPPSTTPEQDAQTLASTFPKDAPESSPEWWERKRKELWDGLSPELRASFCRPKPGAELKDDPNNWIEELVGSDVEGADASPPLMRARMRKRKKRWPAHGRTLPCLPSSQSQPRCSTSAPSRTSARSGRVQHSHHARPRSSRNSIVYALSYM